MRRNPPAPKSSMALVRLSSLGVKRFHSFISLPYRPERFRAWMALAFAAAVTCLPSAGLDAQQLRAGRNVNVSGRPPFQRENEPSIACSSRNPRFCVAGSNDYTTIEVPGTLEDGHTTDSWLGLFWTRDGGSRWKQGLLPGYPQDTSPEGLASPLKGYSAGADANVRAAANGYFHYSGIAFEREVVAGSSSEISGADGRSGVVFVATFLDRNNTEDLNIGPEYVRTVVIDRAALGEAFLDKIWMMVDIPRAPGQYGNIYVAYVKIVGSGQFKLQLGVSSDGGQSFRFQKLSEGIAKLQSPTIAIDPDTGNVYVYARRFSSDNGSVPSGIIGYMSSDFGKTFSKDVEVRTLVSNGSSTAFDQPGLPNLETNPNLPTTRGFRTNSYPASCVTGGIVYVAWAERGWGPNGETRVVYSTVPTSAAANASAYSTPSAIDNHPGGGHQFMPSLACEGGRPTALWYDQRHDRMLSAFGNSPFIFESTEATPRRTLDIYAKQGDPAFEPGIESVRVSRYLYGVKDDGTVIPLQESNTGDPLFAGGKRPFIGDYIEVVGAPSILPDPDAPGGWKFNRDPELTTVYHSVFADNRDVRTALNDDWLDWTPAGGSAVCDPTKQTRIRDQNIYTSALTRGLTVLAPWNSRPIGDIQRAFVVVAQNTTAFDKLVLLTVSQPSGGGKASFKQYPYEQLQEAPRSEIASSIAAHSQIARSVFVTGDADNAFKPVTVEIKEIDTNGDPVPGGLSASVVLDAELTALAPADPDVAAFDETHEGLFVGAPVIKEYLNPDDINPDDINPDDINPDDINPDDINPDDINPDDINVDDVNPDDVNSNVVVNSSAADPGIVVPEGQLSCEATFGVEPCYMVTQATWTVTNGGNVGSSYTFLPLLSAPPPPGTVFQLLVYRVSTGSVPQGCNVAPQVHKELLANVTDPELFNPDDVNPDDVNPDDVNPDDVNPDDINPDDINQSIATFALAPGDELKITLNVLHNPFDIGTLTGGIVEHARDALAPVAFADSLTTDEDTPLTILKADLLANDVDPNSQELTATLKAGPSHGTVDESADGLSFIYTPDPNYNGVDSFTYTAFDGEYTSKAGTVTITITPVNDAPVATADAFTVNEDSGANTIDVLFNDNDADAGQTVTVSGVTQGTNGTVAIVGTSVSYTPNPNFFGGDSFTYTIADGDGGSATATATITVRPVNDKPSFTKGANQSVQFFSARTVVGWATGISPGPANESGQALTFNITGNTNPGLFSVPPAVSSTGTLTYTPAAAGSATITLTLSDNGGTLYGGVDTSDPVTFTITVTTDYGFVGVQNLPPPPTKTFKPGSSVPLRWQFTADGVAVDSRLADPQIIITGPSGTMSFTPTDPGRSSFQPPTAANGWTWQFNWQTVTATGTNLPGGVYTVAVKSQQTGQTFPASTIILK